MRVRLICSHCLGRPPSPEQLEYYTATLRSGKSLSRVMEEIEASPAGRRHQLELTEDQQTFVELLYQQYLGRGADPEGLQHNLSLLRGGMSRSDFLIGFRKSAEAQRYAREKADELAFCINTVFQQYLGRDADLPALQGYMKVLQEGMSFSDFVSEVYNSSEAINVRDAGLLGQLSDGQFVLAIMRLLGHGCTPSQLETWRSAIRESPKRRIDFLRDVVESRVAQESIEIAWNPYECNVMGTGFFLTQSIWHKKASKLNATTRSRPVLKSITKRDRVRHSGTYVVSAIASLYKGRRFLETFLENIVAQSIFDRSELIIIDADSPEGESGLIHDYQKVYPNIVYRRINHRIGIYEAWNLGIQLARGRYITNTNLDDLRRSDSFELQVAALDRHGFADAVYQPVLYSFDDALNFDEVSTIGIESIPPIATPGNLLERNWLHNAPMWRKTLHDELGLFDTSFVSAGDWEFWLRCASKGKVFYKLNEPHVVYFQNPEGISTRPNTKGIEEARRIMQEYCGKLISPYLLMSREALAGTLGVDPNWDWSTPYFRAAHDRLKDLGRRYKEEVPGP